MLNNSSEVGKVVQVVELSKTKDFIQSMANIKYLQMKANEKSFFFL